jgi:hypothetical protein
MNVSKHNDMTTVALNLLRDLEFPNQATDPVDVTPKELLHLPKAPCVVFVLRPGHHLLGCRTSACDCLGHHQG